MRFIALAAFAAILLSSAASAAYIPAGSYCDSPTNLDTAIMVSGSTLYFQPRITTYNYCGQIFSYNVSASGAVNINQVATVTTGSCSSNYISKLQWMNSSVMITYSWSDTQYTKTLSMAQCPPAASDGTVFPAGPYCDGEAQLITAGNQYFYKGSGCLAGGRYQTTAPGQSADIDIDNGNCTSASTNYLRWDAATQSIVKSQSAGWSSSSMASIRTFTMGTNCTVNNTIPSGVTYCVGASAIGGLAAPPASYVGSYVVFGSGSYAWVFNSGSSSTSSQRCTRTGTYNVSGSSVQVWQMSDSCGSSVSPLVGLQFNWQSTTNKFTATVYSGSGTFTTFGVTTCTPTADPMIASGQYCGGQNAMLIVTGTEFLLRPDVSSQYPLCIIAGMFTDTTDGSNQMTIGSGYDTTCGSGVNNLLFGKASDGTYYFVFVRGWSSGMAEGYSFSMGMCAMNATMASAGTYTVNFNSGAATSYMIANAGGNFSAMFMSNTWLNGYCTSSNGTETGLWTGRFTSLRGGKLSYMITGRSCSPTLWIYDLTVNSSGLTVTAAGSAFTTTSATSMAGPNVTTYCGWWNTMIQTWSTSANMGWYVWTQSTNVQYGTWMTDSTGMLTMNNLGYTTGSTYNVQYAKMMGSSISITTTMTSHYSTSIFSTAQCASAASMELSQTGAFCSQATTLGNDWTLFVGMGHFVMVAEMPSSTSACVSMGEIGSMASGIGFISMPYEGSCSTNYYVTSVVSTATGFMAMVTDGTTWANVTLGACAAGTGGVMNGHYCSTPNASYGMMPEVWVGGPWLLTMAGGSPTVLKYGLTGNNVSYTKSYPTPSSDWYMNYQGGTFNLASRQMTFGLNSNTCSADAMDTPLKSRAYASSSITALGGQVRLVLDSYSFILGFGGISTTSGAFCYTVGNYSMAGGLVNFVMTEQTRGYSCGSAFEISSVMYAATTDTVTFNVWFNGATTAVTLTPAGCASNNGILNGGQWCNSTNNIYACAGWLVTYNQYGMLTDLASLMVNTNNNTVYAQTISSSYGPWVTQYQGINRRSWFWMTNGMVYENNWMNAYTTVYTNTGCPYMSWYQINQMVAQKMMMPWQAPAQLAPVGYYCGMRANRTGDTISTDLDVTLVVTPANMVYLTFSGLGKSTQCTMTGSFWKPLWSGNALAFARADDTQDCYWSSYTPSGPFYVFQSWWFDPSKNMFTVNLLQRSAESDNVGTTTTWTFSTSCASVLPSFLSAAFPPAATQGVYTSSTYTLWNWLWVVKDTAVMFTQWTDDNGWTRYNLIGGQAYRSFSGPNGTLYWDAASRAYTPTAPYIYNFTNYAGDYVRLSWNLNGWSYGIKQLSSFWYAGVPTYTNGGSTPSGPAGAGKDDSSDSKKTGIVVGVVIAVIVVVVVVAIVVLKGKSGSTGTTGAPQGGQDYRPMNSV